MTGIKLSVAVLSLKKTEECFIQEGNILEVS